MPESGTSGSVRGVRSNVHPYRNKDARALCSSSSQFLPSLLTLFRPTGAVGTNQYRALPGVRANGIASRPLARPVK